MSDAFQHYELYGLPGTQWRTGESGMLQSKGLQRVEQDLEIEQEQGESH